VKNLTAFSALLVLVMAGMSYGQFRQRGGPTPQQDLDKMTKACGLSEDQVKRIKDNEEAREKATVDVRAAMEANYAAIQDAMKNEDTDKRNKLFAESSKLGQQLQEINKKYDDAKLAVLSDEQKAKWADAKDAEQTEMKAKTYTQYLQGMTKVCGLSDDQVKSMVAMQLSRDRAVEQWQKDNADVLNANMKAIIQAMHDKDPDKLGALTTEAAKLQAPMMDIYKKCDQDTMAVMTDDQRAKWIEYSVMTSFLQQVASFELTDDQKAKLKEALKPLAAEKGATIESVLSKLMQKLFGDVLTLEQKTKWLERTTVAMVEWNFISARLTDDQKSSIKDDYKKLVADEKNAPDIASANDFTGMYKLVYDISKKLQPQIQATLSDDQKKSQEKATIPGKGPVVIPAGGPGQVWR